MAKCAFCGERPTNSSEHLLSKCLLERSAHLNVALIAKAPDRLVGPGQVINDVCKTCNNEKLSELDSYICELFDRYFNKTFESGSTIEFQYNRHLLTRWLLKSVYNVSRSQNPGPTTEILSNYAPYLIGDSESKPNLTIFTLLLTPFQVTREHIDRIPDHELDDVDFNISPGDITPPI